MSDAGDKTVNTVTIEVDNQAIEVPAGSMIIEATDKHGIRVPRFCYHKKLSVAANCRMCMVDVEKAPKPLPACATPVMDGMKVYTQSKRATSAQKNVMEFLLINHPLDCPICDQGGECELQDVSMGYGRDVSRYHDSKRVVKDENLGSLLATDMTRCILCTRCVRFLEEIAGTDELGGMGRGDRTNIGTFVGRSVDSEMSGNVIDVCPVGALTNKPFRYKARAWELMASAAVSMHDAIGSNLYYHARRGRILRTVPRDNEAINECWIPDRDRYGIHGLNAADRVLSPEVKENGQWRAIDWQAALGLLCERIKSTAGQDIAVHASGHASTEEYHLLNKLFSHTGCTRFEHRNRQTDLAHNAGRENRCDVTLDEVAQARHIVLIGSHVRHEQPILNHRIRQAWLSGAKVASLASRDYALNFELQHKVVANPQAWVEALGSLAHCLGDLAGGQWPSGALGDWIQAQKTDEDLNHLAKQIMHTDHSSVFVIGQISNHHPHAGLIKAVTAWMAEISGGRVLEMADAANANGAVRAGFGRNSERTAARLNVFYQLELQDFGNAPEIKKILENSDFNVVFNAFADDDLRAHADLILPVGLLPEITGSVVNQFGQRQISMVAGKAPGESRPGWRALRVLGNLLDVPGFDYQTVDDVMAETEQLNAVKGGFQTVKTIKTDKVSGLMLDTATGIYHSDMLVRRSTPLQDTALAAAQSVMVNPRDLLSIGFNAGDLVGIEQQGRHFNLTLTANEFVAVGTALINTGQQATVDLDCGNLNVSIIGALK